MSAESHPAGGRFWDYVALWTVLGSGLLLMPYGAFLVPALSIERAVLAALVAAVLAALLVAAVTAIAARSGRSTLDLLAAPFGDRGRLAVAALLAARHVLFAAFALVLITDSATLIGERALGVDLRAVWALLFGCLGAAVMLGLNRSWKFWRVWAVVAVLIAGGIGASAYAEFEIPSYLQRPATGGWPSFWQAVDVMLVFPLLWLPVAADYARSAGDPRAAARGAFAGLVLMAVVFGTLGIIYLPAFNAGDVPGFLVGMELGVGALLFLVVLQLDEVSVNAAGLSPLVSRREGFAWSRWVGVAAIVAAVPVATFAGIVDVEPYLLLAGSVFVPAFGVVIAQSLREAERSSVVPIVAWAGGFLLYQWITPADIGWWRDVLDGAAGLFGVPYPLTDKVTWLGGALPAFLFALAVHSLPAIVPVPYLSRRPVPSAG